MRCRRNPALHAVRGRNVRIGRMTTVFSRYCLDRVFVCLEFALVEVAAAGVRVKSRECLEEVKWAQCPFGLGCSRRQVRRSAVSHVRRDAKEGGEGGEEHMRN
jgi:hypothetical protein